MRGYIIHNTYVLFYPNMIYLIFSYMEKMELLSQLFTDRPQHPMDTAIYWLEYVIKYKGAPHLRSAALDLTWYQYLLLDIIAFLLVSAIIIVLICKFLFKKIINMFPADEKVIDESKEIHQNGLNNNNVYQNGKIKSNGTNSYSKTNGYYIKPYQNGVKPAYTNGVTKTSPNGVTRINSNGVTPPRVNEVTQISNGVTQISNGVTQISNGVAQTCPNGVAQNGGSHLLQENLEKIINRIEQICETGRPKWE